MMDELRQLLATMKPGPVEDRRSGVETVLAEAWESLAGGGEAGMAGNKLHGRAFDVFWLPPVLSFRIERHGAIVAGGSGYAEVQAWEVNVAEETATRVGSRKRRVRPAQSKLDVEALAVELTGLILSDAEDERIRRSGGRVQVRMAKALPSAAKQTTQGRQKRLNASLGVHLGVHGWVRGAGGWWGAA